MGHPDGGPGLSGSVPRGLKPNPFLGRLAARLKPCPFKATAYSAAGPRLKPCPFKALKSSPLPGASATCRCAHFNVTQPLTGRAGNPKNQRPNICDVAHSDLLFQMRSF